MYRPPNSSPEWIGLFESEVFIARTTGSEFILIGDFNFEFASCSNFKRLNFIQLFDLLQLVKEATRVTQTS